MAIVVRHPDTFVPFCRVMVKLMHSAVSALSVHAAYELSGTRQTVYVGFRHCVCWLQASHTGCTSAAAVS
jgi:hypothetical protein